MEEKLLKPVVKFLKEINMGSLFLDGKCLLVKRNFEQYFLTSSRDRPIFILEPKNCKEKFVLIIDGTTKKFGSNFLSKDRKTVMFRNIEPLMFIVRVKELGLESFNKIMFSQTDIEEGIYITGLKKENKLCEKILEIGFIPPANTRVFFTATFDHEHSKVGRFTLLFE